MRRTALVTGANSGIGLAIASRLLSSEINVIAHAKCDTDNLVQIKDKRLTIVRADLSSTKDTTKLIKEISEKKIDILVNNAGT